MISAHSPHLRHRPPALRTFIDVYVGRMRRRFPTQGVSHRQIEEIVSPIAIELGRDRYKKSEIYDVFLSFKGRNVKTGFVVHLYEALTGAGFRVLLDTHQMNRGDDIFASLQQAIEVSRILIPIFSHNYAQSAWCLREVSLIAPQVLLQGKDEESAIAVPLFDNLTLLFTTRVPEKSGSPALDKAKKKLVIGRMLSSNSVVHLCGHFKRHK